MSTWARGPPSLTHTGHHSSSLPIAPAASIFFSLLGHSRWHTDICYKLKTNLTPLSAPNTTPAFLFSKTPPEDTLSSTSFLPFSSDEPTAPQRTAIIKVTSNLHGAKSRGQFAAGLDLAHQQHFTQLLLQPLFTPRITPPGFPSISPASPSGPYLVFSFSHS